MPNPPMPSYVLRRGVAVVSGAAQGIGAAVAGALAAQGLDVAALDRDATTLAAHCATSTQLHPYPLDVSDSDVVTRGIAQIEAERGPIEYLVNVAGILRVADIADTRDADWLDSFAVNTHGVFFLSRAVARRMRERRRGGIVTVSSNAASTPRMQMGAYAASKAASAQLMRCLGLELAEYGIRCNLVSPGSTDTEMQRRFWRDGAGSAEQVIEGSLPRHRLGIPLRKLATPDDIAQAVLFLLSDAAGHITLQDLVIDGGATF